MSTEFTNSPNPADIESPMFAPIPSWERGKKRRAFGRSAPRAASTLVTEERSFAPADPVIARTVRVDTAETEFAGTPTYATMTTRKNNAAPIAIAAGLVLLGGLGAAGYYATRAHDQGIAELTPGAPVTTTTTTETPPAADTAPTPGQLAAQDTLPAMARPAPVAAAAPKTVTHTTTSTAVARRAPAPQPVSRSVQDSSVNAAAQAPSAPAFHGLAPAPAPSAAAPAPLVLTPAPTQSVAPPAETAPAPASTPAPAPTETPQT